MEEGYLRQQELRDANLQREWLQLPRRRREQPEDRCVTSLAGLQTCRD